jgi:isopentenyl diphosphate isomerase/L-lactate dehydrogenase-like FMN-dependent dehydrogenase
MSDIKFSRREALGIAGAVLAGCGVRTEPTSSPAPIAATTTTANGEPGSRRPGPDVRWAPANELVNTMEFEEQAQRVLSPELFQRIAGGDPEPFNRITFRPRMNVPTLDMDLGAEILGQTLFTPLVLGPIAELGLYHEEGETAMVRGAAEAYTGVIISSRSSVPFERLVGQAETPLWYSVYAEEGAREQARSAAAAGAGAIFITVGAAPIDWRLLDSIREGLTVPVAVKGIRTPADASAAVDRGFQAIVVSNHGAPAADGSPAPLDALAPIADTVAGRLPILADGSFRRGADIVKGLTLGAQAVLMGRPAAWALAAYGSEGVRSLLQLVHEELARNFGMLGVPTPAQLTRQHIRVHRFATG